jgi:hypothetical protein
MVGILVLASLIGAAEQPASCSHVRTTEARLQALVEKGVERSERFRRLVDTLNASDVIVYLQPKINQRSLAGYLAHRVVVAGPMRYLQIAVDMRGSEDRLISLVAHELQHAVEVAEAPEIRDSRALARMFERVSISFVCGGCYETKAAGDVEEAVLTELRASREHVALLARR